MNDNNEEKTKVTIKEKAKSFAVSFGKIIAGIATPKDWAIVLKYALPALISAFILVFGIFTVIVALVFGTVDKVQQIFNSTKSGAGSFLEKVGNWLHGDGFTDSEGAYFNIIEENKDLGCKKSSIVTETIFYYYQNINDEIKWGTEDEKYEDTTQNENGEEVDYEINYGDILPDLRRLSSKMKKGEDEYEKYVKNTFLEKEPYKKLLEGYNDIDERKDKIYEEIIAIASEIPCMENNLVGGVCSYNVGDTTVSNLKVRLLQCNAPYSPIPDEELVDFEKYITGVVSQEVGNLSYETFKAQAVAARSYALMRSKYVGAGIGKIYQENGQSIIDLRACTGDQAYCDPDKGCWSVNQGGEMNAGPDGTMHSGYDQSKPWSMPPLPEDSPIRQAVKETEGMVALDENGVVLYTDFMDSDQNTWDSRVKSGMDYQEALKAHYPNISYISSDCKASGNGQIRLPLDDMSLDYPCDKQEGRCSSDYNPARLHPTLGVVRPHNGIDFPKPQGTPIYTIAPGVVVVDAFQAGGAGLYLTIGHDIDSDGKYDYYSRYFHMSEKLVKLGDTVSGGQIIGKVGSTGVGTGPHLHIEIQDSNMVNINPRPILIDIQNGTSVFNQMITTSNPSEIPYYNVAQNDANHPYCGSNTIQTSGCWPASFAMIVSGLKGESVTPATVADFICANKQIKNASASDGGGTDATINTNSLILNHFGVKSEKIETSEESIKNALTKGKPVILNVPGHYVVISKYINNKYTLLDSGKWQNKGEYSSISEIIKKLGRGNPIGAWAFERG